MTTIHSTLNAHTTLSLYLQRHKYTKGAYAGDAPADESRRAKTNFRVTYHSHTDEYRVLFHSTYILVAKPDGTIVLDCGGWDSAPTTREAIWMATKLATGTALSLHTHNGNGLTQTALRGGAYYDGLTLDSTKPGLPQISPIKPLKKYIKDRAKTQQVLAEAKEFRATLPLLHAVQTEPTYPDKLDARSTLSAYPQHAALTTFELWPVMVTAFYKDTPQATWSAIYKDLTERMVLEVPA
jgi:hypothetical protein